MQIYKVKQGEFIIKEENATDFFFAKYHSANKSPNTCKKLFLIQSCCKVETV